MRRHPWRRTVPQNRTREPLGQTQPADFFTSSEHQHHRAKEQADDAGTEETADGPEQDRRHRQGDPTTEEDRLENSVNGPDEHTPDPE
jgi:hypothetical protein